MKQANPTTLEKAIEVYELKTIFTGSVSAIIIGRLILGLADVIEQNNRAAFQFEEINRKLDIMMGKNNDEATESVDEASTDYAYPSVETDALNKRICCLGYFSLYSGPCDISTRERLRLQTDKTAE